MSEVKTFLASTPLFKDVPERAVDIAAEAVQVHHFKPEMVIFQEGEPGEALYIIAEGLVKVSKIDLDGHEKILAILKPLEFFGEIALLTQQSRNATASTLTKVMTYMLFKDDFFRLVNGFPGFSLNLTSALAVRLRTMGDEAQILSYKDAQGRVAYVLLRLYQSGFIEFVGNDQTRVKLTHQELANLAGTSRETVSRVLKSLEAARVIKVRPKEVLLCDLQGLEEILHGVR